MSTSLPERLDPEHVLAHARFVRALARGLAGGGAEAEELAARTLAEAIERPPRSVLGLRSWFRRVTWRLFRRERRDVERRGRRERASARPEALPAAADLVAQMELERRVGEAFATLDEPFKSALFRRYFLDESPAQIAVATSTPLATVKSRLQRGLAQLRVRLDVLHEGRREEWLAALVPWVSFGGPIVATKSKATAVALAAVVVAGSGVVVLAPWQERADGAIATTATAEPAVVGAEARAGDEDPRDVATMAEGTPASVALPDREEVHSIAELRAQLAASRRLDQVRAIELLLEQGTPEAVSTLLDVLSTSSDPLLVALIADSMLGAPLDCAPQVVAAFEHSSEPEQRARLSRLLARLGEQRPELGREAAQLLVEALQESAGAGSQQQAILDALVLLGPSALEPVAEYLVDPNAGVEGAGAAAEVLARMDPAHAAQVREALRDGLDALRRSLEESHASDEARDAARRKSGSLAWAAGRRPLAEHDPLARDLAAGLVAASDAAQAGTLAWGLANLKGLTDAARLETVAAVLDALPSAPDDELLQCQAWAIGRIVAAGYESRPLDAAFQDLVRETERSLRASEGDARIVAALERLLAGLRELERQKGDG